MTYTRLLLATTAVAGLLAAGAPAVFAQGLPTQKVITIDIAQTLAQDAMASCRASGYHVTVMVVDHANIQKAFLRDDGASSTTVEIARLKANSVMAFGRASGPPPNTPPGPPPPPFLPGTINAEGGLPIMAGDQLIGAIAVSGAPGGDKDAACGKAALAKVADKLK